MPNRPNKLHFILGKLHFYFRGFMLDPINESKLPLPQKVIIFLLVHHLCQVRFFYSFTCRENLYLVMEYLNGGDLYSLLRNLGCLDEDVARIYIAEVVRFSLVEV